MLPNYVIIVLSFANYIINTLGLYKVCFYLELYSFFIEKKNLNVEMLSWKGKRPINSGQVRTGNYFECSCCMFGFEWKYLNPTGVGFVLSSEQPLSLSSSGDFGCGFG
jgi:hypothetical protein